MYWKDVEKSLGRSERIRAADLMEKINDAVAAGQIGEAKELANELETIQRTQWMIAKQNHAASRVQSIDVALLVGII